MNYEKDFEHQSMLNPTIRKLVDQLILGSITREQLHSRKYYAKSKKNILAVIEYSTALEIVNMLEDKWKI